jgi:hypothetical protein
MTGSSSAGCSAVRAVIPTIASAATHSDAALWCTTSTGTPSHDQRCDLAWPAHAHVPISATPTSVSAVQRTCAWTKSISQSTTHATAQRRMRIERATPASVSVAVSSAPKARHGDVPSMSAPRMSSCANARAATAASEREISRRNDGRDASPCQISRSVSVMPMTAPIAT